MSEKLVRPFKLLTPQVPNYILTDIQDHTISVVNLTDAEVEDLGKAWAEALKAHPLRQEGVVLR